MSDSEHRLNDRIRDQARHLRREMTIPERALWRLLRGKQLDGHRFRRQHPIGSFVVDFCCVQSGLVVELDGLSHVGTGESDDARTEALARMGYRVIRFTNDDVLAHGEAVVEAIRVAIGQP